MSEIIRSVITGVGGYLPDEILTNHDLANMVDTTDEWIVERTGIHKRHRAAKDQATSDLAVEAAKRALDMAGRTPADLDLIIVATTTPDLTFPATAAIIQRKLGAPVLAAFDIQAVCSGFVFAMTVADNFLVRGQARCALVIGAETMTRLLDWSDRTTCVLFGDGAGAVILEAQPGEGTTQDRGMLAGVLRTEGAKQDLLYADGGPSTTGTAGVLKMQGAQVFRHAVGKISEAITSAASAAGITVEEVDWFIPHQANLRILQGVAEKLGLPEEKVVMTVGEHANTSAASIPLALAAAVADGRVKRGDLLLMEALGGGLTWGACVVRF
ncbi:MAG: 3-oxoacyl-ACP synthase [Caulobacteraceae bacterium]|nr:3-oxoacyl-ACP synthase [Caulobacteraceae bacterium]